MIANRKKNSSLLSRRKFAYVFTIILALLLVLNSIAMFLSNEYFNNYRNYHTLNMGFAYIELILNSKIQYVKNLSMIYSGQISTLFNEIATQSGEAIASGSDYDVSFNNMAARILINELDSVNSSAAFMLMHAEFESNDAYHSKLVLANRYADVTQGQTLLFGPDYLSLPRDEITYTPFPLESEMFDRMMEIGEINLVDYELSDYILRYRGYDNTNDIKYSAYAAPIIYKNKVVGITGIVSDDSFYIQNVSLNLIDSNFFLNDINLSYSKFENNSFLMDETSFSINNRGESFANHTPIEIVKHSMVNTYKQGNKTLFGFDKALELSDRTSYFPREEWRIITYIDPSFVQNSFLFVQILLIALFVIGLYLYLLMNKKVMNSMVISTSKDIKELSRLALTREDKFIEMINKEDNSITILSKQDVIAGINDLSSSEYRVFRLYSDGYTPKEVSEILFLSINTVKTHNRRIYEKLGIKSRDELLQVIEKLNLLNRTVRSDAE